ncbi:MAG: DUF2157 domain-containing protein [Robiginitomaculum sp.]|nr:DUF2157 domain-containing protein [Robiginitomaculum sp.]
MRTPFYMKTLQQDLGHWIAEGWVDAGNKDKILQHVANKKSGLNVIAILAILGVVLLGFAAISFVAANWAQMDKLFRVGFILATMWVAFGIAAYTLQRKIMVYAHAFGLLGAILFGAGIMLIAQTFNIQAHYPTGVLIWFFGAFATALVINSKPVLIFSTLLAGLWMSMAFEGRIPDSLQLWLFPVLAVLLWLFATRLKSITSLHILAICLLFFIPLSFYRVFDNSDFNFRLFPSVYGGVFVIATLLFSLLPKNIFGRNIFVYWLALAALFTGFYGQFIFDYTIPESIINNQWLILIAIEMALISGLLLWVWRSKILSPFLLAIIFTGSAAMLFLPAIAEFAGELFAQVFYGSMFLIVSVILIFRGAKNQQISLVWFGGISFTAQTLYVYFETFKDLLNTSLFFLIGGLILLVLSIIALRFTKKPKQQPETQQVTS